MANFESHWKEFDKNEISHSAAHYLLVISSFKKSGVNPRAADLARQLGISRTAVSQQTKVLAESGLIKLDDKNLISLTLVGNDTVSRISNKRAAVKEFLIDILGVNEQVAEKDSCKVEHLLSEDTGHAITRFLNFLKSDDPVAKSFLSHYDSTL